MVLARSSPAASSVKDLYPTQADLDEAAAAVGRQRRRVIAFNGPPLALDTLGGQVAFQIGTFGSDRHRPDERLLSAGTRAAEEEAGRLELVRGAAVGRHAPLAAALIVVAAMDVAVGALVAAGPARPRPPARRVGGLRRRVRRASASSSPASPRSPRRSPRTPGSRRASPGPCSARAFVLAGDRRHRRRHGLLALADRLGPEDAAVRRRAVVAVLLVVVAALLAASPSRCSTAATSAPVSSRRGPARPTRVAALARPLGWPSRLQRGSVSGGRSGSLLAVAYGSIADAIDDFVGDNEASPTSSPGPAAVARRLVPRHLAADPRPVAAGFAVQALLRPRGEETSGRAEACSPPRSAGALARRPPRGRLRRHGASCWRRRARGVAAAPRRR